jgi:hypothetical protein
MKQQASQISSIRDASAHQLPIHDGGLEVISTLFIRPRKALQMASEGKMLLMPPQFYLLTTLAELLQEHETAEHEIERISTLCNSTFGHAIIRPERFTIVGEAKSFMAYEGDEVRGGPPGRKHRMHMEMVGKGVRDSAYLLAVRVNYISPKTSHSLDDQAHQIGEKLRHIQRISR